MRSGVRLRIISDGGAFFARALPAALVERRRLCAASILNAGAEWWGSEALQSNVATTT